MDTIILGISLTLLMYFVVLHTLALLVFKEGHVLNITRAAYGAIVVYGIYATSSYPIALVVLALFMLSLFIWVYHLILSTILFETSVYMKLISVLKGQQSLEEILKEYNSRNILDSHLKRLLASREIQMDSQSYRLASQGKRMFLVDSFKQSLRNLVDVSSK